MWGDPVNGHIITTSNQGLVDIDPIAGTFRVANPSVNGDGLSVSLDGRIAYVEVGGAINSYNTATGTLLKTYAAGSAPDGTGVISGGRFNGDVIVNGDFGTVGRHAGIEHVNVGAETRLGPAESWASAQKQRSYYQAK